MVIEGWTPENCNVYPHVMDDGEALVRDEDVIERILDGDVDAFEHLLNKYDKFVFGIVMKHVPGNDAETVAHDVFVRAYQSLPGYRSIGPFRNWLSKIAVRTCHDFWRERYRSREVTFSSITDEQSRWVEYQTSERSDLLYDEEINRREARDLLDWAMDRLTSDERMVLQLVHIEERPVKEAAELLGWSAAKVKVKAHRSRKKLRKILGKLLEEREVAR